MNFFWPFTSLRQNEIYKIILGSKFSKFTNSFLIFFFRKLLKSPKIFSTISSRGSRKMLGFQITLELLLQNVKQVFSLIQTLSLKYQSTKKVFNFFWIGNKVAACQQIFSSTKSFFWQKELEQGFSSKIFFSKSFFILNSKFLHFVNFFFFSSSSHFSIHNKKYFDLFVKRKFYVLLVTKEGSLLLSVYSLNFKSKWTLGKSEVSNLEKSS